MTVTHAETETTVTSVITEEVETPSTGSKDPDKRHMINPPMNTHIWKPGMETSDIVDIAVVRGLEIIALCGYRWVPSRSNTGTAGLQTCEACIDMAGKIMSGDA